MKNIIFKGVASAIPTPFDEKGVNFDVLGKFVEWQIDEGVDAIVVCGTTGESATMSTLEKMETIKFVTKKVNKRIPVIAGTGSNDTKHAIEISKYAESIGVDGLLIVTPYYNKTTQNGLLKHYSIIAENTHLPIIIYNVPSRTGLNIEPETCFELSKIPNIIAIKEASGNISQVAKIANLCGDNLHIYSGNDDQILPILSLGGLGVISVLSNIKPKFTSNMIKSFFSGDINNAIDMQIKAIPLINSLFSEVNPIPIKEALNMHGFNFGEPRLPLIKMSENKSKNFKKILEIF